MTLEDLRKIVPETEIYQLKENESPKSPGLKHKHYAPTAKVFLMENGKWKMENGEIYNPESAAFIGLSETVEKFQVTKICRSVEEYAHEVFAFFRHCDALEIKTIYCETVKEKGIGAALMDRLKRAAEG